MSKSIGFCQEEYCELRSKVEGRIRELESKLVPIPSPQKAKGSLLPIPATPHHHHHYQHHCHSNCCHLPGKPTPTQMGATLIEPLISQVNSLRQINLRNSSSNELLSTAIAENLRNQRQINEHIKAINEKIENLSLQHNQSNLSEAFSESLRKPKQQQNQHKEALFSEEKMRCHSQYRGQEENDPNATKTKRHPVGPKKVRGKMRSPRSPSKLLDGSSRKGKLSKSKSKQKVVSEYFLSFGCPVHSPTKISLESIRRKEVYKDSEHRNRKHEKNHLLESFKQQERSRERLLSKISQYAFSDYGNK